MKRRWHTVAGNHACVRMWSCFCVALLAASVSAQHRGVSAFTEEAVERGIDYPAPELAHGVALVDLDDDGDADIVTVGGADGLTGVFENDGTGHFWDRSATCGLPLLPDALGVTAADYDRDGDLDLYFSREIENVLVRNLGNLMFEIVENTGAETSLRSDGSAWTDFDNDGWIDLAIPIRNEAPNVLLRNLGDGTFEDVSTASGFETGIDHAFQIAFFDMDFDGDGDGYIASDAKGIPCSELGFTNTLLENVGGSFVDVSEPSGADICIDAMCVAVGDFSGNGFPDLFITNTPGGHALLRNNGDGTFDDVAALAGVDDVTNEGWGSVFLDYDNDGLLDLYVCTLMAPNRMFRGGDWPVTDLASSLGVDVGGLSFTVATADIDLDGDLDMVVNNHFDNLRLFINNAAGTHNWARFDVHGREANRYAIGTTLRATAGGSLQAREVIAGSNFQSQNELVQHFGLGDADVIDELIVMWPGGITRTLTNIPANHTWAIYPLDKCGDADGDGDRDLADFFAFRDCFTGDSPATWLPGCERMDYQGDSDVDLVDFAVFLSEYDGPIEDCNNDGTPDLEEILLNPELDADNDGALDECGTSLPGDVNSDGSVGLGDLLMVLSNWGSCTDCPPACPGDANNDCSVGLADLLAVLSNWGS